MKTKPTLVVAAATLLAGGIVHAGDGVVARMGAVRFGTSAAALTAEQVNMLRAEKPNGRTVRLYITSDGYLALRGMVISIH